MTAVSPAMAQTQQGYVKTKGRLGSNGQVVAGTRLSDAIVQVKGRNAVRSGANGTFALPIPSNKYYLQTVKKNGYTLLDPEVLLKLYIYSPNPLILVMETLGQQQDDKLAAEKKLRRSLQRKLQEREDALEEQMEQNKVTREQYRQAMDALYEEQNKNGQLISEMAEHYAQVDYDLLDDFNRQVNECILNGELIKADSLLRSKGDVDSRIDQVHQQEAAQAAEQAELARRQQDLDQAKAGTRAMKEDIALDCHNFFKKFVIEGQPDSAALYIEKRANLNPDNSQWQFDAGSYLLRRGMTRKAEEYLDRALNQVRKLAQGDTQQGEPQLATTLNMIALLYQEQGRLSEARKMLDEALQLYKRHGDDNPEAFKPLVASTLNNLGVLHSEGYNSLAEAEPLLTEALEIYSEYAEDDALAYGPRVADVLNNLGILYDENELVEDSENMYLAALGLYRRLAEADPKAYTPDVAAMLNNLSTLYHRYNVNRDEAEQLLLEAIEIYSQLANDDPQLYLLRLAVTQANLAVQYYGDDMEEKGEMAYDQSLDTYRRLAADDAAYKSQLGERLFNQGVRLYQQDKLDKSEQMFTEALPIYLNLAELEPSTYQPEVAKMLRNIANLLDKRQQWAASERMYLEELAINKQLASRSPQYTADVARTLGNLSNHALLMQEWDKAAQYAREGIATDGSKLFIQANLAAALLFMGNVDEAKAIYSEYKNTLRDTFIDDLNQFAVLGIIPKAREADVQAIRQLLNQ